jgi:hypothetical protein
MFRLSPAGSARRVVSGCHSCRRENKRTKPDDLPLLPPFAASRFRNFRQIKEGWRKRVGVEPGSGIENTQLADFSIVWIVRIFTIGRSFAQISTKLAPFDQANQLTHLNGRPWWQGRQA